MYSAASPGTVFWRYSGYFYKNIFMCPFFVWGSTYSSPSDWLDFSSFPWNPLGEFCLFIWRSTKLKNEDFSVLFFVLHSLNLSSFTYNCTYLKKKIKNFIWQWKLTTALSFCLRMKYLNLFLLKIIIIDERQHIWKVEGKKTELKNLHFSTRYLQSTKQ